MLVRVIVMAAAVAVAAPPALAQQKKQKGKPVASAAKQRHQCKVGPYEKQTRLVMETVRDKPVYIAYWSSNGPFHCSFETWPGDGRARWTNSKGGTVINLISGSMLIEKNGDRYFVHARDVARMPYCGTFCSINGVLTVPARKGDCNWKETEPPESASPAEQEQQAEPTPGAQASFSRGPPAP
jgi:hypothetical protein